MSGKETFEGMAVIKDRFLISHMNPLSLKQFCENEASYLSGLEKFLTSRLGFEVNIFTIIQKEYLRCKHSEQCYRFLDKIIVGPRTYEQLLEKIR